VCDATDPETWTSLPNDTQCSDGNICTTGDACQDGLCAGAGSGYVGPGEQCAPATPATPGPFGDFHCLLEEIPGSVKNVLTMGTGDLAMSWTLRGSMDFSFAAGAAKMTKLSATGQKSRLSLEDGIAVTRDALPSSGTVDTTTGDVQMTMPIRVRFPNGGGTMPIPLTFTGQVADRVLQGEATAPGGAGGHVKIFCREQFRNVVASATFQLDGTGSFLAPGPVAIFEGTPTMPGARSVPGAGDLVAELVSVTGEILDQYGIGQPWTATFPNLPLPPPPPDPSATVDVTIRAPLSNRLGSIILRTSTGVAVAESHLAQAIDSFCTGTGSQYCDYRTGGPVRTVFYAPGTPAPSVNPSFAEVALPSSPRMDGDEYVLTTNWMARQPDIALDADGNAIVVWREDYEKIMAQGISKTGQTLFGPTRINDIPCVTGWVPGEPPPDEIIEWGDQFTARAVVATSNTARKPDGSADSTFAVAWGGLVDFVWHGSPDAVVTAGFQCSRLMNGDGTALQDPVMVVPAPSWDGSEVSLRDDTHVSLAMTESRKFVIAWSEYVEGAGRYCVAARPFGADGLPATANAVFVSYDEPRDAVFPTVAMDKNGQAAIVWIRTDDPDTSSPSTGHARMQRFNTDFTKRGDIVTIGASTLVGGIPSVAMRPSTGDILISARSKDGDIYATRTRFSDGALLDSWSPANSRAVGTQARPVAVMNGEGGYLLAWMDEVGPESNRKNPITAQVYGGDGRPLDVDFTASPQTPIYTDANGNPDFYWSSAFAFRAGAAQNDYALVWQRPTVNHGTPEDPDYEGGIVLQRLGGGAPDCPAPTDCGTAVPIRVTGATEGKIDVILTPGEIVHYDTGAVLTSFTTPYTSEVEFGRKAVDLIVNGYLANNVFSKYVNEFNFYFDMTQGKRRMQYLGGECQYLWGGTAAGGTMGGTAMFKAIGYQGSTTFANVGAVIMRHYNPCGGIDQEERGLAVARYGASGDQDARTGGALPFWVKNADDYSSLVHESGHAVFGLREEYCVGGAKEDPLFHSNSFDNQQRCVDFSVNPDNACRAIPGRSANVCGGGFWKADPDDCAMSDGWGTQFGLDCQRRAQCVVEDIRNTNDCP